MPEEVKKEENLKTEEMDSGEKAVDSKEQQSAQEIKAEADALKATTETTSATQDELNLNKQDIKKLYKWGKEVINYEDVVGIVSSLKDPYKTDIIGYIKKDDIEGMQKYLNGLINDGTIDKVKLREYLNERGITFSGANGENSILEDGKFGPQTLYTMKFIVDKVQEGGDDKKDGEKEEKPTEKEKSETTNIQVVINQYFIFNNGVWESNPEAPAGGVVIGGVHYPEWKEGQEGPGIRIIKDRIIIGIFDGKGKLSGGKTIFLEKNGTIVVGIIDENRKKAKRWTKIDQDGRVTVIIIVDGRIEEGNGDGGNIIFDPIVTPGIPKKPTDPEEPTKPEEPTNPESKEKEPDLSWIREEMTGVIDSHRNGKQGKDWYEERHDTDGKEMVSIDTEKKYVYLTTHGRAIEGGSDKKAPENYCQLDWKTGKYWVHCGDNWYELPLSTKTIDVDKDGNPVDNNENRLKFRAFAEIANLINFLKANYVYNGGKYSFEAAGGDIEYNNGTFDDTEIVGSGVFDKINSEYFKAGIKFDKSDKQDLACLLNAMKLDLGNLTLDELEDGCYDEDVARSKKFSKKYS